MRSNVDKVAKFELSQIFFFPWTARTGSHSSTFGKGEWLLIGAATPMSALLSHHFRS
jgi:hypothetical protein